MIYSRAAKTYGVETVYVVTPLADQQELVRKIVTHWTRGAGAQYNESRKAALDLIRLENSLEDVADHIAKLGYGYPKIGVTSAGFSQNNVGYRDLKRKLRTGEPHLLVFGTAWGLAKEVLSSADFVLEPIEGNNGFNHLSVRCAVAIILDRLLGDIRETEQMV